LLRADKRGEKHQDRSAGRLDRGVSPRRGPGHVLQIEHEAVKQVRDFIVG
jgi:hypothetical protein